MISRPVALFISFAFGLFGVIVVMLPAFFKNFIVTGWIGSAMTISANLGLYYLMSATILFIFVAVQQKPLYRFLLFIAATFLLLVGIAWSSGFHIVISPVPGLYPIGRWTVATLHPLVVSTVGFISFFRPSLKSGVSIVGGITIGLLSIIQFFTVYNPATFIVALVLAAGFVFAGIYMRSLPARQSRNINWITMRRLSVAITIEYIVCAVFLFSFFPADVSAATGDRALLAIGYGPYGYSESAYYGYGQGYYYGYGQGYYYGYGQGYYYGYAQGYYYGYSQGSYASNWEDTVPACGATGTFYSGTTCSGASTTQPCR